MNSRVSTASLVETIKQHRGNVTATAEDLGVSRQSVYRRAARADVNLDAVQSAADGPSARARTSAPRADVHAQRAFSIRKRISEAIDETSIDVTAATRRHVYASAIADEALELGLPLLRKKYGLPA